MTNYPTTQAVNQFDMAPVVGQGTMIAPGSTLSCQVDAAQVTAIVAGQAVKLSTSADGVPQVIALAANTDKTFGFALRNLKDVSYPARSNLEIAISDSVMWMQANGAITRGANVEVVIATNKITTSGGVNPVIGITLDTATVDGDFVRVLIKTPTTSTATQGSQTIDVVVTLAQINAGLVLIPGQVGQQIEVTNVIQRVVGNFATGTAVILQSDATNVAVLTTAEAGLTNGAVLLPSSANQTLGAGFGAKLPAGEGLKVVNSGAAQTAGTSVEYTVTYKQV